MRLPFNPSQLLCSVRCTTARSGRSLSYGQQPRASWRRHGAIRRDPTSHSRTLSFWLCAFGLWNAVAYHAFLFTQINPLPG